MFLVPHAARILPVGSSSSWEHHGVALGSCHSSAACVCSCSSSPGSIEEHTYTLVLMGSIAYARLKNVTNTLRIARRLEGKHPIKKVPVCGCRPLSHLNIRE